MPKATIEPLIKPQSKDAKERLSLNLSTDRINELKQYAKFLSDSDGSYVVDQALEYLFKADRAYRAWLRENTHVEKQADTPVAERSEHTTVAAEPQLATPAGKSRKGDKPSTAAA